MKTAIVFLGGLLLVGVLLALAGRELGVLLNVALFGH